MPLRGRAGAGAGGPAWRGYGGNAQHTAPAPAKGQKLHELHWKTSIDLNPQYSGGELLIHYGSPMITASNTILIPVKTGADNGFRMEAHAGADGSTWSGRRTPTSSSRRTTGRRASPRI